MPSETQKVAKFFLCDWYLREQVQGGLLLMLL